MTTHRILIALDSVGIDPLGHNRPDSVYSDSRFLFPKGESGEALLLKDSPRPGILVETDVTDGAEQGAIECAITATWNNWGRLADIPSRKSRPGTSDQIPSDMRRICRDPRGSFASLPARS